MNALPWLWWFRRSVFFLLATGVFFYLLGWFIPDSFAEVQFLSPLGQDIEGWAWPACSVLLVLAAISTGRTALRIWRFYRYGEEMCIACAGPVDESDGRRGTRVRSKCRYCGHPGLGSSPF